jgi:sugar lactone lactonase YvrE
MKNALILFLIPTCITVLLSCENKADKSVDFTEEFLFTEGIEGPAVDSENNLYAVNFEREGTIGIVNQKGQASLFIFLPNGSIGNGIRFDRDDNMFIADYVNHNVLKIAKGTKEVQVYAHHDSLSQPNDLAIAPDGTLYASDPNWKDGTGSIWKIDPSGFTLLESDMGTTNGIEVSPEGDKLYVNESVQRKIWVYDINAQGDVENKRLFYEFEDFGMDGMRCDIKGNLYVCRYDAGKVVVLDPGAKIIREVVLKGKKPSNITFGGKDHKQCFVTLADRGCFETFTAEFPGKGF